MCNSQPQQQYTTAELYEICYKRGNFLFIDGQQVNARFLPRDNNALYIFVREEQRSAAVRNIYVKPASIQQSLF